MLRSFNLFKSAQVAFNCLNSKLERLKASAFDSRHIPFDSILIIPKGFIGNYGHGSEAQTYEWSRSVSSNLKDSSFVKLKTTVGRLVEQRFE